MEKLSNVNWNKTEYWPQCPTFQTKSGEVCSEFWACWLISVSPKIVESSGLGEMRVRSGTTVSMECRAEGHPQPRVTWTKIQAGRSVSQSVSQSVSKDCYSHLIWSGLFRSPPDRSWPWRWWAGSQRGPTSARRTTGSVRLNIRKWSCSLHVSRGRRKCGCWFH